MKRPAEWHTRAAAAIRPRHAFDPSVPLEKQREEIKAALLSRLAMPETRGAAIPRLEFRREDDPRFTEIRYTFESEPDFFVPVHLLLPKDRPGRLPLAICLQGHSPGMFVSMGRDADGRPAPVKGDRDFAMQAVERGFAAVVMEQRGFGELRAEAPLSDRSCDFLAKQALLMGRTLLGERCFDIVRLLDTLEHFDALDTSRVCVMGNSGGGTTSYFAAAVDQRIGALMPSCAFCTYLGSHLSRYHCLCSYLPGLLTDMDMPDIAVLIAPRPMAIVAGEHDELADIAEVRRGFETVRRIYAAAGAPDACRLVVGPEGHRFYAGPGWDAFLPLLEAAGV